MGDDVFGIEDFLKNQDQVPKNKDQNDMQFGNINQKKSLLAPLRNKRGINNDSKAFDQKLVDRAL